MGINNITGLPGKTSQNLIEEYTDAVTSFMPFGVMTPLVKKAGTIIKNKLNPPSKPIPYENTIMLPQVVVKGKKPIKQNNTFIDRFKNEVFNEVNRIKDWKDTKNRTTPVSKYQYGKPIEKSDNLNISIKSPKRNLDREMYYYYNNLINKAFPVTFEDFKQKLINTGVLPIQDEYSVPVGHLGDGYRSVVVSPEVQYGPYDLPQLTINGWGRTLDPEYPDEEQWKDIARKTIQNDSTLSLSDATKYMWALDHPEFKLHPMFRSMATPIQPGPWNRVLYTSGEYEGYLPSDNPKYGGNGTMSYDWDYPSRSVTYKTTKYPPEDWHNKEHLYNWLDKFYNRKNGINK